MATYYFRNTDADGNWNNPNNWWDDPVAGVNGFSPTAADDAVILAQVSTATGEQTVNTVVIDSGGETYIDIYVITSFGIQNGGRLASGTITGVVNCLLGGIVGYASNATGGPVINGPLTFFNSGSTDANSGYQITVNNDIFLDSNWTGSVSDCTFYSCYVYYGYTGTFNLAGSNIFYTNFPILYYNNATNDGEWNNIHNWWVDSGYTQKSAHVPTSSTAAYILGHVFYDSSSSATADTAYFSGGYTIDINLNIINDATFTDNDYGGSSVTLTAYNVYFDGPSGTYGVTANASVNFGNECRFTGYAINNGTVQANGGGTGSIFFDDNSSNTGIVGQGATSYTVDFSDNSANGGTVNINANVNYPLNRNTFNTGYIYGTITYVSYPEYFYFYGGNDWNNTSYWWTGSLGTGDNAAYIPGPQDSVIIQAAPNNTANNISVYSMTIDGPAFVLSSSSYTVYVSSISVENGSIGDGMTGTNIECGSATFNNTSSIAIFSSLTTSDGCTFNGTSDINGGSVTGEVYFYDSSTFSGGTITGNATVYYPHAAPLVVGGTITGSLSYSGYPNRTVYYNGAVDSSWTTAGNWWNDDTHSIPAAYAPDSAISLDNVVINGNITSGASPTPTVNSMLVKGSADVSIDIICDTATFEDNSTFSYYNHVYANPQSLLTQVNTGTVSITFSELSGNYGTIYVADYGVSNTNNPPVVFEDGAYVGGGGIIYGNVEIYYPVSLPYDMTINYGSVTYFGYPYYFNDSVGISPSNDGNWATIANWFLDSANTIPAGSPPSNIYPGENVILQTSITQNTSLEGDPTVYNIDCGVNSGLFLSGIVINVINLATFENGGILTTAGSINGNALFKDTSTCQDGNVSLTATFTLSAAETMIDNGYDGTYGDIEFQYGKGVNGSSILGLV